MALNGLSRYCEQWRISINAEKSSAVLFHAPYTRAFNYITLTNLLFNNTCIPWEKETKYLGVILDSYLNFKSHITWKVSQAKKLYFALWPLLHLRSKLSLRGKVMIYKMIIRSSLTYACPCWAYLPPYLIDKMQLAQNFVLRKLVGARWFQTNSALHRDLQIPSISEFITKTAIKFFTANVHHPNQLFKDAITYDWDYYWRYQRPRSILARGPRPPALDPHL